MTAIVARTLAPGERRRGAALPIVLLFAALLAGLAASAMRSSLSGVRAASVFAEAMRADALGRGAADALAYHLATHEAAARRGGRLELHLPHATIDVDYRSESARVDANLAPLGLIAALLVAAGAEPAEAAAVADRIRVFRERAALSSAGGAANPLALASTATPAASSGSGPPAAPGSSSPSGTKGSSEPLAIRDVAQVARAWGLTDGLARRVLPALTVSNGTPEVDPVLAGPLVLRALLGSDDRVDDYLARRASGFATEDFATEPLPVPARTFAGFHDSDAVRAEARVALAHGFARRYEMILAPAPSSGTSTAALMASSAPVVVSWRRLP